jgi:REP element-mobilizing transposase RayT
MPRPWRIRYAGAKYHLTVRGNARDAVFLESCDYKRFLEQLQEALEKDEVVLYAYAVMPNHYHLLVETPLGNVQKFMQRLNTAYGMYFRHKHGRVGHCFQGRYGARLADGGDYLLRLTRYIHLNPVKTKRHEKWGLKEKQEYLERYPWSSYRGYAGLDGRTGWINYRLLKLMERHTDKGNHAAYRKYMAQMMGAEDEVLKEAKGRSIYAIGDEKFAEITESDMKSARYSKVDTGDIVWPEKPRQSLKEVMTPVLDAVGLTAEDLKRHGRATGDRKLLAVELLCQMSSAPQRAVAPFCGYKRESSVGKQRKLFRARLNSEADLSKRFEALKKKLDKTLNASF